MSSARGLLELGAIILGLGLLGRLAALVRISPIPLYLLAGLVFGVGGLLPLATSEAFVSVGADVGIILLLLMLGLEYSADELLANLRTQSPAGVVDFVVNAAPGALVGMLLGWPAAGIVAMAGVTYATSSGIVAKLLTDLGRLGNRETPVVLSLMVFEDLLMAIYLPVLTALLLGVGVVGGTISVVGAVVAVALVMFVALRWGRFINRLLFSASDELLLLGLLGFVLIVAGFAEELHVSTAVGAFLVGIALSGQVAESARLVLSPLRDLFAAVFFVFFGLRTDPAEIPDVLGVALALALVTILTKVGVGGWAARRAGIARPGQLRAGAMMVPRGEFSIVIAGLATSAGIAGIGPLAATYVMIMAVVGPILARLAEPVARRIAVVAKRREARRADPGEPGAAREEA
ncbi:MULTISPECIES: cation:proton antiporter [unclassified Pseudactinotalea]|uniref:cation:proton antiporter n=1 Tax=unclassified Pseudactinotalea TaxID=2649176 RepID=UPI00128D7E93|nr:MULTISPECIES: cation:proton antiporter [unclassified Pseudactinotalea]MPV50565.1 cation:proton antiporter [Pseudactinotalea sp. HY160]QGH70725.1 cation:proton antiporter [Pseudactinotalea sp. HY158]